MSAIGPGAYGMRQAAASRPLTRLPMPAGFSAPTSAARSSLMAGMQAAPGLRQQKNAGLAQQNMALFQRAQRNPGFGQAPTMGFRPTPGFKGGSGAGLGMLPTPPTRFMPGRLTAPAMRFGIR